MLAIMLVEVACDLVWVRVVGGWVGACCICGGRGRGGMLMLSIRWTSVCVCVCGGGGGVGCHELLSHTLWSNPFQPGMVLSIMARCACTRGCWCVQTAWLLMLSASALHGILCHCSGQPALRCCLFLRGLRPLSSSRLDLSSSRLETNADYMTHPFHAQF